MKIVELSARENHGLFLRYEDGVQGGVDLSSLVGRGVFSSWSQPGHFEQVQLSEHGVPEWPGELDLCPDWLYMQLAGMQPEDVFPTRREQLDGSRVAPLPSPAYRSPRWLCD